MNNRSLIQSVPKRWNFTYYGIKGILKQQHADTFTALIKIHKSDLMPSDGEITAMKLLSLETSSDGRLMKQMKMVLLTDLQSRYTDLSVGNFTQLGLLFRSKV